MIGHTSKMTEKRNPLGATGETVRANVIAQRQRKNLSYAQLSRKLKGAGRAIPELGLRRIEEGDRRVDVDDLMALAAAFNVSPIALLVPEATSEFDLVEVTGRPPERAARVWDRLRALYLTDIADDIEFFVGSNPNWALNYGLLADKRTAEDWSRRESGRRGNH